METEQPQQPNPQQQEVQQEPQQSSAVEQEPVVEQAPSEKVSENIQEEDSEQAPAQIQEEDLEQLFEIELSTHQIQILQALLPNEFLLLPKQKPKMPSSRSRRQPSTLEDKRRISSRRKRKNNAPKNYADFSNKPQKRFQQEDQEYTARYGPGFSNRPPKFNNDSAKQCFKIIVNLKRHHSAAPFLEPVDPIALELDDYYDIIKEPMDLQTVEQHLRTHAYTTTQDFALDVRKIWNNSFRYNPKDSEIYKMTTAMSSYFEKLFRNIKGESMAEIGQLQRKVHNLQKEIRQLSNKRVSNKPRAVSSYDRQMSLQEKRSLGQSIRQLPPECLRGVWEIVSEGMPLNQQKEELTFDIDKLPNRKSRELEKFVKFQIAKLNRKKKFQVTQQRPPEAAPEQPIRAQPALQQSTTIPQHVNVPSQQYVQQQPGQMQPQFQQVQQMHQQPSAGMQQQAQPQKQGGDSSDTSFITESDDSNKQPSPQRQPPLPQQQQPPPQMQQQHPQQQQQQPATMQMQQQMMAQQQQQQYLSQLQQQQLLQQHQLQMQRQMQQQWNQQQQNQQQQYQ